MSSVANKQSKIQSVAERAARDLMRLSHWGGASFISLPLVMPSGTFATVRIGAYKDGFTVDDGGFAFREIEAIGAERSFPKVAAKFAGYENLETDRRRILTYASEQELQRAIIDVATASHSTAAEIYRRIGEEGVAEVEDYLRERLETIFIGAKVSSEESIKGASSHPWEVTAAVHLDSGLIVFQAVGNHPYSVYKASTAFHDLGELSAPPTCVAVVQNMEALGVNLNVLAQAGRVIQGDHSDDTYRRAAA